jgi:hypothetical protein
MRNQFLRAGVAPLLFITLALFLMVGLIGHAASGALTAAANTVQHTAEPTGHIPQQQAVSSSQTNMATWFSLGPQPGANYGVAVAYAGDINNDGYEDALVGANWYDDFYPDQGQTLVYYGTAAGLPDNALQTMSAPVEGAEYGTAVTAGDFNNDGFADTANGAPYGGPEEEGRVVIYHGTSSNLQYVMDLLGPMSNDRFGFALASGDVNGNGYDDLIVGAPGYQADGLSNSGAVLLYYGGPDGLSEEPGWMVESYQENGQLGYALAIGDFNDDGYADIAIGAKTFSANFVNMGAVFVFYGSAQGPAGGMEATLDNADWAAYGESADDYFGAALAAGDVNGNGVDDLIVGAPGFGFSVEQFGAVYGFWGSANGLGTGAFDWFASDYQPDSGLGTAVAIIPDINGDGTDEVLVGAPNGYPDSGLPTLQGEEGRPGIVSLYLGGSPDPGFYRDLYLTSDRPGSRFGQSLAASSSGILVGAPQYVADGQTLGAVFGFTFSPISGLTAVNSSPTPLGEPTSFAAFLDDGGPAQFDWDFGDGNFGTGQFVEHTYEIPGLYTAVVTAISPIGTLTAETAVTINVIGDIDPEQGGTLDYLSPTGWGINVIVPPNAVDRRTGLSYVPLNRAELEQPPPPNPSTYFFDLDPVLGQTNIYLPYISNGTNPDAQLLNSPSLEPMAISQGRFDFLRPITVTIVYTDDQIPGLDEEDLILVYWDVNIGAWVDAITTCDDPGDYIRDPANNRVTLQICHLTRFGLSGN